MNIVYSAYPPRPTGGQIVGMGPQGVKGEIEELGLVAICQTERSQHKNKRVVQAMLEYGLAELGMKL